MVAPIDGKAVTAIEQLTGKTIDWADAPQSTHEPREHGQRAPRHESRQDQRPRKDRPQKDHQHREPAKVASEPAKVAHIDQARARRSAPRTEEGSDSHLPAFLLRPVKLKA
jgi:hypothetical protein